MAGPGFPRACFFIPIIFSQLTCYHCNDIILPYHHNDTERYANMEEGRNLIKLFHGTNHIIETPDINKGNVANDYGRGFYCTRIPEMAMEWACKRNEDGFANSYELDLSGLRVLNLMDGQHTVLNWIALLLKNRILSLDSEIAIDAKAYIIEHFSVDTTEFDIITGYRADDSYFRYAESFVQNGLSVSSLSRALRLGKLGEQTVLVSEKAFAQIRFTGAEFADKTVYYPRFIARDLKAREDYRSDIRRRKDYRDDIFVMDIIREEIKNDDPRIQRILSE